MVAVPRKNVFATAGRVCEMPAQASSSPAMDRGRKPEQRLTLQELRQFLAFPEEIGYRSGLRNQRYAAKSADGGARPRIGTAELEGGGARVWRRAAPHFGRIQIFFRDFSAQRFEKARFETRLYPFLEIPGLSFGSVWRMFAHILPLNSPFGPLRNMAKRCRDPDIFEPLARSGLECI